MITQITQQILDLMKENPEIEWTELEMSHALGTSLSHVALILKKMTREGLVIRINVRNTYYHKLRLGEL